MLLTYTTLLLIFTSCDILEFKTGCNKVVVFQDFSVDSILNMASSLDKMLDTVMGPVVGVTNNIVGLFQGEGQSTRNALFESFAEATKNIPNLAKDTLKVADRLMGVANKVKNMPFMTKFKEALVGMKSLVEDVRSDATGLFNVCKLVIFHG